MVNAVKDNGLGLYKMDNFSSMRSHQALQASSLVGRQVFVQNDNFFLKREGEVLIAIDIPTAINQLMVSIHAISGETIKQVEWAQINPGFFQFTWDGMGDNSERQIAGQYKIKAFCLEEDQKRPLNTFIAANVDSVSLGEQGREMRLNVAGIGSVSLDALKFI